MQPIPEENILFLNDPDPIFGNRKGITVSKLDTPQHQGEIRIAIWTFISVPGGFITPRKGGISLTQHEFTRLIEKESWAKQRIKNLKQEELGALIDNLEKVEEIDEIQKRLDTARRSLAPNGYLNDPRPTGRSGAAPRKRAHPQ